MAVLPVTSPYITGIDTNGFPFMVASEHVAAIHIGPESTGVQFILVSGDKINLGGNIDDVTTSFIATWATWIAANPSVPATVPATL